MWTISSTLTRAGDWPLIPSVWRFLLRWRFRIFQRRRYGRMVVEEVAGHHFVVLPTVFNPKLFRTGEFLAETLDSRLIPPRSAVLDLGTGSGVGAVVAARWARRVLAVDINPEAVRCARVNVLLNRVEERVEVRPGDLFVPVQGERFDRILFNPPYYEGTPRDAADQTWRGIDLPKRLASELSEHLRPDGSALVTLSTDADERLFVQALESQGFRVEVVAERPLVNETLRVYRAERANSC